MDAHRSVNTWAGILFVLLATAYMIGYQTCAIHRDLLWGRQSREFRSPLLLRAYWPVGWLESNLRQQVVILQCPDREVHFTLGRSPRDVTLE